MPPPNADAVLAEIDRLAEALPGPAQKRRLAGLRVQLAQLIREARAGRPGGTPGPAPFAQAPAPCSIRAGGDTC